MSILSALKTQTNSIDDLAALPQAMIMQMAQKGQIRQDMLAPILSRKAEMAEAVARTKAMQGGGQQPTVMEQIMQKNAEAEAPAPEARDMGVAQLPVRGDMYQGMAGGGIVAFVDGGDVEDDDENEAYQDALEDAEMEAMMDKAVMTRSAGLGGIKPPTRSSSASGAFGINPEKRPEPGNVTGVIQTAASKYNLPPELMERIASSESGGRPDAANKLSSAKGLFQFTDATWKGMGGKEGEQFDPERNAELGGKFIRQNAEGLKNAFGRNPTYAEVYAAHYFGLDGAKQLMNMDQDLPMSKAVSEKIMKANPNLKGKTIGQVMASLEKKTGRGIVELAKGGEVRHFATGDYLGFYDEPEYGAPGSEIALGERLSNLISFGKFVPKGRVYEAVKRDEVKKDATKEYDTSGYMKGDDTYDPELKQTNVEYRTPANAPKPPAPPVAPETAKDAYTKAIERFEARQQKLTEREGEDKNLALLAAGLGMMGGTSPYALTNIGAGGQKGVEQYAAAKRGRAAEELANEKALAGLLKTKEYAEIRGANAKALEESRLRDDLMASKKQIEANVMSRYKGDPALWDPKTKAKVAQEIQQALSTDEYYNLIAKRLGVGTGNVQKPATIDFNQIGKK